MTVNDTPNCGITHDDCRGINYNGNGTARLHVIQNNLIEGSSEKVNRALF
jgi:hypothetical protein